MYWFCSFKPIGHASRGWAQHTRNNQVVRIAGTGNQGACAPTNGKNSEPQDSICDNGQAEPQWNSGEPIVLQLAPWSANQDREYGSCYDKTKNAPLQF